MPNRTDLIYRYDGTFEGLLTCVFEGFAQKEAPAAILSPDTPQTLLYPSREIETDFIKARRVLAAIPKKISQQALDWVTLGFFTCHPEKELLVFRFLKLGFAQGAPVTAMLYDNRVRELQKAVDQLTGEAHKWKGFVRFSDTGGALTAIIEPKNMVLPLLSDHFSGRYPREYFMIYDKTHGMALIHRPGKAAIIPVEGLSLPQPDAREQAYRRLWKRFYDTIAIEGRNNPRCRMSQMPKRYWKHMTELTEAPAAAGDLPETREHRSQAFPLLSVESNSERCVIPTKPARAAEKNVRRHTGTARFSRDEICCKANARPI